ncbi:hypothetical protein FNYG_07378 [Fusarium nygamai]|uniref:CHAT domain-containing protein n=1 Tax=Gibberella nygamai TaxID=42673 RepID=A0A2K0WAI8_GIBNY|nr:hypothetical protein FNYG_07378 [Fusarium nygamai]
MERFAAARNTFEDALMLLGLSVIEHKFVVGTRCQPDPKGRSIARKGLENIQMACQAFQGCLDMEAECRYYWAELILDQATSEDHFKQLVARAVEQYTMAQNILDLIQHGIGESPKRFDDWISKRAFKNDGDREREPNNAVAWLILAGKLVEAWEWIQRWKAASLAETVGLQARKRSVIERSYLPTVRDPEGMRMLEELDKLAEDLVEGHCTGYQSLAEKQLEYNRILAQLKQHGDMKTILSLRGQCPISKTDFDTSVAGFVDNIVYVDWIHLGSSLLIVVSRPRGHIDYEELGGFHDLMRNLDECFHDGDLRNKSPQRIFGRFEGIIEPLQSYTAPGETLVLSPTESMHRLPLHALNLKGEPLIKRNPVVYSYSASLMAICAERRKNSNAYRDGKAVVIGNPNNDSIKNMAAASMDMSSRAVAKQLQTGTDFISPTRGMRNSDFKKAAEGAAILHYHGHAKYKSDSAAEAGLVLAGDDILTPKDVADLQLQEGAHVTLIACHSGKQDFSLGNEPLGIVPAFLVAGACSVLATLWPIPSTAGQRFSESFYQHSLAKGANGHMGGKVDLARAFQQATLNILHVYGENSTNWASFALKGVSEF